MPVVSVGNLTLGGTGKTPMVLWIARWLRKRGVRLTLISRGYGVQEGARNDEALELEDQLPDVPHLQNPDRVEAARSAVEQLACQLILLDDAFQHRRIYRDLDIVLLDATEPFGYGHVFPRGMMREPPKALARADVVALSRADMVNESRREALRRQVERFAGDALWLEMFHKPRALLRADGTEATIDRLTGCKVAAFCGIGNPLGFRHTLASCGCDVVAFQEFPDHHAYEAEDLLRITQWVNGRNDVAAIVCTHKDLVKIGAARLGTRPLWALAVGMEIIAGQAELEAKLAGLVERVSRTDRLVS